MGALGLVRHDCNRQGAYLSGAITLVIMQQIVCAFGRVDLSRQDLVRSQPTIVELI